MLPCCVRIYYKMQLRSSVANGAAYPTCLTTVYALTNILFVGFRKKKRSITQKERKGQAAFRRNILNIYENSCAITGIKQKEVLEAAKEL